MCIKGIVRYIDKVGRIVVPKEMREILGINDGDPVEILFVDDTVVLKKYESSCKFCNSQKHLIEHKESFICKECLEEISRTEAWNAEYEETLENRRNWLV